MVNVVLKKDLINLKVLDSALPELYHRHALVESNLR